MDLDWHVRSRFYNGGPSHLPNPLFPTSLVSSAPNLKSLQEFYRVFVAHNRLRKEVPNLAGKTQLSKETLSYIGIRYTCHYLDWNIRWAPHRFGQGTLHLPNVLGQSDASMHQYGMATPRFWQRQKETHTVLLTIHMAGMVLYIPDHACHAQRT